MTNQLKAGVGRCEEASSLSREKYIPCNAPAARMVGCRNSSEGPYRMCEACAWHNIKNRGGVDNGPYRGPTETPLGFENPVDFSAYAADAELSNEEKGNILAQITSTAREMRAAEADIKAAEAILKAAQDRYKALAENTLPLLMDEAQQRELVTLDGWRISRSEVVRAGISADNMPAAAQWLNANGQGAIIKREVQLKFGKGEEQKAAEAVDALREHGFAPTDKLSVHAQTLGAVVRELLAEGKEIPIDLLGVYIQPIVKQKQV